MVILSAALYLVSFLCPNYAYSCLFIWMLPLLMNDEHNTYGFKQGYAWGLIFYLGHLSWLAYTLYTKGQVLASIIAYLFLLAYLSLFSGFWFWVKQLIYRLIQTFFYQKENYVALCLTWFFSTVIFMLITKSFSFAIFDCFEGYYLSNPLLPLVCWLWFMQPIFYFGELFYLFIIVTINIILYLFIRKPNAGTLIFLITLFLFPCLFQKPGTTTFINQDHIVFVQPLWNNLNLTAAQKFYAISHQLDQVAQDYPIIRMVVMPESSFGHNLLDWQNKLEAWTSLFTPTTSIFIGAHRKDNKTGHVYNSLYQIQDGRIVNWHDKEHLVFFTERQPQLFKNWVMLSNLFVSDEFSYPEQQDILLSGFQPAICSEIFCGVKEFKQDAPILFICHDAWFGLEYAQKLAKNAVKLYAIKYNASILYVGVDECCIL